MMKVVFNKKIGIGVTIAVAAILSIFLLGGKDRTKEQSGPEAAVKSFHTALISGDFDLARSFCDSISMKGYIDEYARLWESMQQEDSITLAIASSLLSGAQLNIEEVEKTDKGRWVHYTIEAAGEIKEKTASVIKEEGKWIVETITERI